MLMRLWFVWLAWGCAGAPPPLPPTSDDELARGAARTFLACYERDGAECRAEDAPVKEWSALAALALVRDGIPTEIIDQLPQALEALREDSRVRRDFIAALHAQEGWVRSAGCTVQGATAVGTQAVALAHAAAE